MGDGESSGSEMPDGRAQRSRSSRRAVATAALDLITEGHAQPTTRMIEERSGVSHSSIFRLFGDLDSIYAELVNAQRDRIAAMLVDVPRDGPLDARVGALVANRRDMFEAVAPLRPVALRLADHVPDIADGLRRFGEFLRAQTLSVFADELEVAASGSMLAELLDALTSFEAWHRLRSVQGLSIEAAEAAVGEGLRRVMRPLDE